MFFDSTYILVIIGAAICLWAQSKVKSTFSKFSKVNSASGLTGKEVAQKILHANGVYDVSIQKVSGSLTDYYDPSKKVVCLSDDIYSATSVAALGVAAHECGHAIQDATDYTPLRLRTAFVPVVNIGSKLAWPLLIGGIFISAFIQTDFASTTSIGQTITNIGIILFSLTVVFQLITLPVEFNASNRALEQLENLSILGSDENKSAGKVLKAAALTYVAAAASGLLSLLRIVLIFGGGRKNRN